MEDAFLAIKKKYYESPIVTGDISTNSDVSDIDFVLDTMFAFCKEINLSQYSHFLDMGSSDGRLVAIASLFTKSTGVEINPVLHEWAVRCARELGLTANFILGNYNDYNISAHDVVFFGPDRPLGQTRDKLLRELRGVLYVDNTKNDDFKFLRKYDCVEVSGMTFRGYTMKSYKDLCLSLLSLCNSRCIFCPFHSPLVGREMPKEMMDFERVQQIIREASELGFEWVELGGEGDPSLYPRLHELIVLIKEHNMKVELVSNMYRVVEPDKIDFFNINFSAYSDESYKHVYQVENSRFDQVVSNIKAACAAPGFVRINFVLNKLNYTGLVQAVRTLESFGIDEFRVVLSEIFKETTDLAIPKDKYEQMVGLLEELKDSTFRNNFQEMIDFFRSGKEFPRLNRLHRNVLDLSKVHIDSKGNVYPGDENYLFVLGNAFEDSLRHILAILATEQGRNSVRKKIILEASRNLGENVIVRI